MSKFNPLPRDELLGVREEEKVIKHCRRFNSFYPMFSDSKRGVIYLKLREKGCKKKSALSYCSKPICRTDSTRQTDGPSNNRTLKVKSNSLLTQNGWQFTDLAYDLGKKFYTNTEEILSNDDFDKNLLKDFMVNEEKIRDDFKKKIKNLSEFYEQLNKKYNFARLDKRDLLHKLKDMNSNIQKNKEIKEKMDRFYIPCCDFKVKTLVNEALSSKNLPSSLVKELDIFPKYNVLKIPSEKEFQDIYYETRIEKNDSEKIENFQKKSEKNILSRKSTLSELSPLFLDTKRTSKKIDLNSLYDLKKLKAKSQLFLNLEAQNKYIEEITNDDKMIIEAPDPKRKKEKDEIHKINKFDGGLLMAEEFNKANYMYPVKQAEIQETDELKPQSIINKTKMHHFQRLKSIRMGLSPELRENNSNIQNLQIFHNIKYRNSQNNDKNIRNSIEEEFTQKPFTNEIKNRKNNLRKTQITFSQLQIKTKLDENHEKLDINSNENYETEDPFQMDEIKKEISFQKDLKKFVRTNISSNNMRSKEKITIDTSNIQEFITQIQDMRQKEQLLSKLKNKKSETQTSKSKPFKFNNFFKTAIQFKTT